MRDFSSAMRDCSSSRCSGLVCAFRNGRASVGSMPDGGLQRRRAVDRQEHVLAQRFGHIPPGVEACDDLLGDRFLHREKRVVCGDRPPILARPLGHGLNRRHQRIRIGEKFVLQPQGMQLAHGVGDRGRGHGADRRLRECAIEGEVDLRHARRSGKAALVLRIVTAERTNVVECPRLAAHYPLASDEVGADRVRPLGLQHRFVKSWRQHIDQVDIAGELVVLLACDAGGNKNAEMPHGFMDRVDNGLAVGAELIDVLIEIQNPSERLLRRSDIVALRAEHHDRRTDIAQVDCRSVRRADLAGRQLVANEKVVDDRLDLGGVQIDMSTPPALEAEIARRFGVNFGIEIVLLGP